MMINGRQSGQTLPFALQWNVLKKNKEQTFGSRFKGSDAPPELTNDSILINANHNQIVKSLQKLHAAKKPEEQEATMHKLILTRSDQMFLAFRGLFHDFVSLNGKIAHSTGQALAQMKATLQCQAELLEFLRRNSERDVYLTLPKVKKSYQALDTYFKEAADSSDSE